MNQHPLHRATCMLAVLCAVSRLSAQNGPAPIPLDSRRELFVDHHFIDQMKNVAAPTGAFATD